MANPIVGIGKAGFPGGGILTVQTDPTAPLAVTGSFTTNDAKATAAAPVYVEGTDVPLSVNLAGGLRLAPISVTTDAVATAASPLYIEGSSNPLSVTLAGALRTTTTQLPTVLSQTTMAASLSVTIASDQSAVPVSGPLTDVQLRASAVPISGTVTANIGTSGALALDATLAAGVTAILADLAPLATQVTLATRVADATITARLNTLGQKLMAVSAPIVIASDQSAIPTIGTKTSNGAAPGADNFGILPAIATAAAPVYTEGRQVGASVDLAGALRVTGTVTVATNASVGVDGAAKPASDTLMGGSDGAALQAVRVFDGDTGAGTQWVLGTILRKSSAGGSVEAGTSADPFIEAGTKTNNGAAPGADNFGALTVVATAAEPAYTEGRLAALSTTLVGRLRTSIADWLGSTAPTVGQKLSASSIPVVLASDYALSTTTAKAGTSAITSVAGSAASTTLLAANAARLGATIYNDSTKILYLKLGATASTTSFTTQLGKDDYYEVPFAYTGVIDGIWTLASGNARITELTA